MIQGHPQQKRTHHKLYGKRMWKIQSCANLVYHKIMLRTPWRLVGRLSSPHLCWVVPPPAQAAPEAAVVHRSGWCAPPPRGLPAVERSWPLGIQISGEIPPFLRIFDLHWRWNPHVWGLNHLKSTCLMSKPQLFMVKVPISSVEPMPFQP
jgi:hypothetical protein